MTNAPAQGQGVDDRDGSSALSPAQAVRCRGTFGHAAGQRDNRRSLVSRGSLGRTPVGAPNPAAERRDPDPVIPVAHPGGFAVSPARVTGSAAMVAWISSCSRCSDVLERADEPPPRRLARCTAPVADRLRPARRPPHRRLPRRRAHPARRPAGPGQDHLGAPGRPQRRRGRAPGRLLLLRARPAVPPRAPGGARGGRGRAASRLPTCAGSAAPSRAPTAHRRRWPSAWPTRPAARRRIDRVSGVRRRLPPAPLHGRSTSLDVITLGRRGGPRGHRLAAAGGRRLPAEGPRAARPAGRGRPDHRASSRASRTSPSTSTSRCWRSWPPTRSGIASGSGCASRTCAAPPRWPTRPTAC